MVSKNNKDFYLRKSANKVSKYTIKKLSVGVASVLLSTTFFLGTAASADATGDDQAKETEATSSSTDATDLSSSEVTLKSSTTATEDTSSSTTTDAVAEQQPATEAQSSPAFEDTTVSQTEVSSSTDNSTKSSPEQTEKQDTTAKNNQQATEEVANTTTEQTSQAKDIVTTADATKASATTTDTPVEVPATFRRISPNASLRAATATPTTDEGVTVTSWSQLVSALRNSNNSLINVNGTLTATSTEDIGYSGHKVTVKGQNGAGINFGTNLLTTTGSGWDLTFDNLRIITGSGRGVIDTGQGNNTITFKDVTHTGNSLFGGARADTANNALISGANTTIKIEGNTTSTVNTAPFVQAYGNSGRQYGVTIQNNGTILESGTANIHDAKAVIIADGANFTLNRSSIGDGIKLISDGGSVSVGNNATFTINMNTNNATDSARYHNAGIFMENSGSFTTGRNSTVNMNTSIGQAVSIGADRPGIAVTDRDRFGGYTANQSRNAGPTTVKFGDYSNFNFTGRDGFILGNNANFTSGEYSNVHFQNKGNGVALDLANDSNIVISKHSNTLFESDGKGNKAGTDGSDTISGSYNAYNYIGVNEGGNILIDEFATFRVIMTNRGANPWDDVISLDSRKATTSASFVSKKGAVVDIRDDNTNFYAELISFPLGAANSLIDIQNPLYLNLQRYSAGGKIDGWMPVGGTEILLTDNKNYGNLIYMGGTKGVLKIGGTDYVVYQQIKSDSAQQIWLNINSMTSPKHGFNAAEIYNNNVNPDMSISGVDLTANVAANNVKDNNTSPTAKGAQGTAPYYGISSQRANHQIWFPHGTEVQAAGQHQNVIKYVYEDGTEAAPTVTQTVDVTRDIKLDITPDQIDAIRKYAATHNADQILDYIKNAYAVTKDSGWKVTNGENTKTAYDAVNTPTIAGYTASIQSTNANGVTVGGNVASIHATLDMPNDTVVENGKLTEAFMNNNGMAPMPANYETVVVYKKEVQDQTVTIIYQDKTNGNAVLATDTITGKPGTELGYTTTDKITELTNKGYKLVTDGVPKNGTFGDTPETYYVTFEHDTVTITPNDPKGPNTPINPNNPASPKYPTEAQADNLKATATLTVHYKDESGATKAADRTANVEVTRTVTIDKVTGEVLSSTPWTAANADYTSVVTPVVAGYVATTEEYDTNDGRGTINADKAVDGVKVVVNANAQTGATATTPSEVTVVYKKVGNYVPVDSVTKEPIPGATKTPYANDPSDPTKVTGNNTPTTPTGYEPQNPNGTNNTYTPNTDPTKDTEQEFVKTPDAQRATLTIIDKDRNDAVVATASQTGKPGEKIADVFTNFSVPALEGKTVAEVIEYYKDRGYEVESNDYKSGTDFDDDTAVDQNFTIVLKHGTTPVTPENPGKPGEPINPNDPDGPKWPAGTDKDSVQKPVKETVHYVGAGDKTPADVVQDATWTRELTVDKVTGEIVKTGDWKSDKENYDEVKTPVVKGYVADKATIPSTAVTQDDIEVTVTYTKVGKIVPVDPSGNPIPNAPTPEYTNDPDDPTKVTPNQPVPSIPGYTPEVPSVTPDDPTKDTPVKYTKDEVAKYTLVENFVDEAGNKLADPVTKGTDYKEGNDYDVTSDAKVIEGYYLKEVPANAKGTFGKGNVTVDFVYAKVGKIVPVDPNGDPIPNAPTPEYTNDPEEPTKVTPNQPTPEIPGWHVVPVQPTPGVSPDGKTVTPQTPGDDTKVVYEKNEENKYSLVENFVDEAGNKLADPVTKGTDYKEGNDYDVTGDAKVIEGYYLKEVPVNAKGTFGKGNVTVDFVYAKVGKIVPVDPNGDPIPNAPTPEYTNDPEEPTKVTPNQPVPEIPGFVPEVSTVTPDKPGEDTPVKYVPVTPEAKDQTAKIIYRDETTGQDISSDSLTGKPGSKIDYSTADKIKELTDKGYVLVNDGFPTGVTFDNDDKVDQIYYVTFKHGTTPVTPENPGKPGEPINPNDPDGPKWPIGTDKDSLQKPVKETVHYVGAGDKTPADVAQDATWTRELTVDKVTGEIVKTGDWKSDKENYDEVKTPVVKGYVADKATVPSTAVTQDDIEVTVTYTKVGKIVPVDPAGNEIPGVDQPSYNNDPDDPTKVTPNQPVPEIPGFVPQVPSVTPDKPGEDTPVVYVPVAPEETTQKAKVIYRDTTTGQDLDSADLTGRSGSKIDYSTADKIKEFTNKGYVLVNDGFPTDAIFDNDGDVDQTYYVNFKHGEAPVGPNDPHEPGTPIDPNDPDGPKWPAKDEYTKEFTSTVHFIDDKGNKVFDDDVQTSTWTRTLYVDTVTGEVKNPNESWKSDKDKYTDVTAPVVDGYYADKDRVAGKVAVQENLEEMITYKPLGNIVPVDPEGNKIPGAPTPQYNNDPKDPTKGGKTPVPEIPGYTPQVPSVTPEKPGEDTPVVYVKNDPNKPTVPTQNDQKAKIVYYDVTTDTTLDESDLTGRPGDKIDYSTADKIKGLTNKGYVLVKDGFPSDAAFDKNDDVDQTYYVTFKHGEVPVGPNDPHRPGEPINPNDPNGPKWPAKDEYTKEFTSTVHFVDNKGNKVKDDDVQTSTWTRTLYVDTVTGEVKNPNETWKSDKDRYAEVTAPVIEDYYADKASVPAKDTVQENIEETITYNPVGKIVPVGPNGEPIPGAPTPEYNNDPNDPTEVTPNQPVPEIPGYTPEVPSVTPDKPGEDTPVKYVKDEAKYSLTVKFIDEAGNELAPQVIKGSDYKKGADYDVSGDAKVIEGYYLKETPVNAKGTIGSDNVTVMFVYAKLGNIVPVDPSGAPIPGADTPTYSNDPEEPGKVVPNQPVPVVPGYTPQVPSVTPDKPGEDTPVVYVPVTPEKDKQAARIIYRDTTTGTVIDSVDVYGDPDSLIDYSTADKIKELTNKGYVLVEDGFPAGATFDNDDNTVQTYHVTFKHGEAPVGPNDPHEPGTPINPNDPNGPKWPAKDEYTKQYTSTVQFVDKDGNKLRDDDVQTSTWTRTLIVDSVTGKVKNPDQAWTSDKGKYDDVTAPVIEGYYADKSRVTGKTTVQEDLVEKITYTPLGKITPQDPNGDPIPNAPTPGYNNDPKDPTKGAITPVPEIPGYTPRVPNVNPEDPGKDTPVVYEKNEDPKKPDISNERDQNAKVIFRDVTTDTDLATEKFTGKSGSKITYSTADKIKELLAKGYVLVNDGFPSDATFDNDNDVDQTYYVTFKHGEAPVGPNDPHKPGTPINPNDPNGPKWPAKDEYTKQYTSTVHFVDKDGNKLRDDDVQTSTWTRTLIVDTVTGKVKNPDAAWTSDKANYNDVKVPVIEGYYADKANVLGPKATQENIETNVVYNKIGKIVPVDPEGNPIPGAPTPQYKNDPNDPTKVVVTDTPDVLGYTTGTISVEPDMPGEDTPVVYTKVAEPEKTPESVKPDTPAPTVVTPETKPQQQPAAELPQTGDADTNNMAAIGVAMVAGLLGLMAFTSKRKKDENEI